MPLYLLDTSVVIALVRGKELGRAIDVTFNLRTARTRPMISVVTHGELLSLARRNGWSEPRLATLQNTLDQLVTVDIHSSDVIDAYSDIDNFSHKHPGGAHNMGKNDLWIAACAKASGAMLLTTDRDFDHLHPALLSVTYVDPKAATLA